MNDEILLGRVLLKDLFENHKFMGLLKEKKSESFGENFFKDQVPK